MRIGALIAAAMLGGCASTTELGNSFSVSVTAFSGGITSSDQLALDLEKDFVRKSEQLEYVSRGSYSCLNPRDPEVIRMEGDYRTGYRNKVQKDAVKSLREKNAYINAILGYGEVVEAYVKQQADLEQKLDKWTTAIGTFSGLVSLPEAKLFSAAATSIIGDIKAVNGYFYHESIKRYANKIGPHLAANVNYLVKKRNLRDLTADEERAFQLWKACAEERLRFIRDNFPPAIGREAKTLYSAMAPSPVWDSMNAYKEYITERETFLGRKPDFGGLLKAIVEGNNAIIADEQDALDSINKMGAAAKTIIDSASGIRAAAAQT
ncbi:hypothetical protein [Bradyrhizobium sp. SZCCHNRI20481]|uniref:hypothetical protein n=1 Tax=Bradyrhizobium sp. SZCCHNRI20481 TaxID=3057286 RepID=UPI002915FA18|nr:hypothetical protein [Bradyrhizobium sp. SZCCHNRI20481]